MRTAISVGVVGLGRRGTALARALNELPDVELRWVSDSNPDVRLLLGRRFPVTHVADSFDRLLEDDDLDAVVVSTSVETRPDHVRRALAADKHVLVEAPLARSTEIAEDLVHEAAKRRRYLCIPHEILFHPAVARLKQLIETGALGEVFYIEGARRELCRIRGSGHLVWMLGADHVALVLHLLSDEPIEATAEGESYLVPGIEDVAFCSMRFATGIGARLTLSALDPNGAWSLTVVGSRRTALLDLTHPRRLTLYETAVESSPDADPAEPPPAEAGDTIIPRLARGDPLRRLSVSFLEALRAGSDAARETADALKRVGVLELLERSLAGKRDDPYDATAVTAAILPLVPKGQRN